MYFIIEIIIMSVHFCVDDGVYYCYSSSSSSSSGARYLYTLPRCYSGGYFLVGIFFVLSCKPTATMEKKQQQQSLILQRYKRLFIIFIFA